MSVTSNRSIVITEIGDVEYTQEFIAAVNAAGSGKIDLANLSSGANTITIPTSAKAVTIIPPSGNTVLMTLKGVAGDTGVQLHLTDPSSIALTSTTFVLNAASALIGLRLIYS